jgi:hypothetical protein
MSIDYDKEPYTLIRLPNGDDLQIIPGHARDGTFWLYQIDNEKGSNRRYWNCPVDLLTVKCIELELMKDPFANFTPTGE